MTIKLNGSGQRKLASWIDAFVDYTNNFESAPIWCKWSAILTVAAVLEQKVWTTTSAPLYPNMYIFLVGDAGLGKSRPITAAESFMSKIKDFHLGATSMTMASLVDHLKEGTRVIIRHPEPPLEYNTLTIVADELSAFMHEYANELIAGLTKFYDCTSYSQGRRVGDIRIKINNPQLNILSGSTPSNLLHFIPETAWEQGFTSRVILIYSNERPMIDVFHTPFRPAPPEMLHDLEIISKLHGQFGWSDEWAKAMHNWKLAGLKVDGHGPPTHPKLKHYGSRRFAHMIKLSMVASIDRGNSLYLEKQDFNRAMGWLLEAEVAMPKIFEGGTGGQDNEAIEEILHFVKTMGTAKESQIVNFARTRIRFATNIPNILKVMESGGLIEKCAVDKLNLPIFKAS